MCRDRILTLADMRRAHASAGGSSSLSKAGAEKLTGMKRAAKAKKAKAAKRAKAEREEAGGGGTSSMPPPASKK